MIDCHLQSHFHRLFYVQYYDALKQDMIHSLVGINHRQPVMCRLLPPRVSEMVGVCHLKAYIFDDDIMISGANLSNTYFSMRQDRYFLIRNAEILSQHIRSLVQARHCQNLQFVTCD